MNAPFQPDLLTQHGRFVRDLALQLVGDSHAADDVAQDTWLRFLRARPGEARGLRPWLRRVVSNLARNNRRAEGNLSAREERAARDEALPSVAEEFERAELLREVVDAVLALEEPYRSTMLARYFRGWDAPRIAAETRTPLATVRSREQRALEQLRARLDRKLDGRAAWALALGKLVDAPAPIAVPVSTVPFALKGALKGALKLALTAAAVIGGVFLVRAASSGPAPSSSVANLAPASVAPATRSEPAIIAASAATPASVLIDPIASVPAGMRTASASASAGPSGSSAALRAGTCEVRGRFLLPGGAPAVGLEVKVSGRVTNDQPRSDSWQDLSVATDAEGRFALVFTPPLAYFFELEAKQTGCARERRECGLLVAGDVKDLGEVELLAGGAIEGRLLDANGAPILGEQIRVQADGQTANLDHAPSERQHTWEYAAVDAETGAFRLEDLAPGRVHLTAQRKGNAWLDGPEAVVVAGQTLQQDLVYRGPDLARRITLSISTRAVYPVQPARDTIHLSGPGIEPRVPATDPPRNHLVFDDLAPGEYTLTIDDPRFLPFTQTGITPGSEVKPQLVGNAALALDVRDGAGNSLPNYTVEATIRNVNFRPNRFRLHPLAGGRLDGLIAGDYTIAVSVDGLGTRTREVEGLLANETRALAFVFGPPTALAGRVRRPSGASVSNVDVLLVSPAAVDDSPGSRVLPRNGFSSDTTHARHELARSRTDELGAFRFELSAAGSYALYTVQGALDAGSPGLTIAEGEQREGVELVLPEGGRIQGHVAFPPGGSCPGLRVWANVDASFSTLGMFDSGGDKVVLAADGSFALGPFAAGHAELVLLLPQAFLNSWGGKAGSLSLGSVELSEGAVAQADFDLTPNFPGEVSVSVLVGGAPAVGVKVALFELDGADELEHSRTLSDVAGLARLPVFPGTYRVLVEDADTGWTFIDAAPLQVAAGQTRSATVSLDLVAGTLTCVDAAGGAPLANESVSLQVACDAGWHNLTQGQLRTDTTGHLALKLPAGEYRFARSGQESWASVTWTATGPLSAQVGL